MECHYCKKDNQATKVVKYYYCDVKINTHKECLLDFAEKFFSTTVYNYLKLKESINANFYDDIILYLDDLPILPIYKNNIEVNPNYLHLLSIFVMRLFLEPKYITCDPDIKYPEKYKVVDEFCSPKNIGMLRQLQRNIMNILNKKWRNM